MTIIPARRLTPGELLSLGNNTHAAVRNDHECRSSASIDDPVLVAVRENNPLHPAAGPNLLVD